MGKGYGGMGMGMGGALWARVKEICCGFHERVDE
jgi:hypothetical protein